jgi:tRNA-2-methylthio-N6-dimethylallyladenosine synthase
MKNDVPQTEKKSRLRVIEELQERIVTESNARLQGQTVEVLFEGRKRGKWYGRNRNDKLVFVEDVEDHTGEVVKVRVERTGPWSLQGAFAYEAVSARNGHIRISNKLNPSRSPARW